MMCGFYPTAWLKSMEGLVEFKVINYQGWFVQSFKK